MAGLAFRRDALAAALAIVGKVQPWQRDERSPALVRVVATGGTALLISTDPGMQIEVPCPCEGEDACMVVQISALAPFVTKAGAERVTLTRVDGGTQASAGRSRITMLGGFAQAIPLREAPVGPVVVMPSKAFRGGIAAALPAAIEDLKRPALGGVHVELGAAGLSFIAQDGNRIHAIAQDGNRIHAPATIPRRAARLLAELLPKEGEVRVWGAARSIWVDAGGLRITSTLIEVPFSSVAEAFAAATSRELRARADLLLADLELVCTVASTKDRDFRLDLGNRCEASAFRQGGHGGPEAGAVVLEASFTGSPLAVGFQLPLVRDALRLFGASEIVWRLGDAESPSIITSPDHPGTEAMVSPIRLLSDHMRIAA